MRTSRASAKLNQPHRPDYLITIFVITLIAIGLIMIYSTGSIVSFNVTGGTTDKNTYFYMQVFSLCLGLTTWFLASKVDYHHWRKLAPWLFYGSIILMFLVLIPQFSIGTKGATRWVKIGFISFQPVEFFKLGVILFLSSWIEKNREGLNRISTGLIPFMIILALISALVMIMQKDMGSAMVLVGSCLAIFLVSGVPLWLFGVSLASLVAGAVLIIAMFPYRLARVLTFINHKEDMSGTGYHINQALIALGSGGILGKGLGKTLQAYGYLPESTNDSIFAIIGEEFGFLGSATVIMLFSGLVYRGLRISRYAPDGFGRSVAIGITTWIGIQAFINIAAMLNLIPLTGVPLPFISYGGTSLLALLGAVGILQNISKYTYKEAIHESSSIRRGDRRSYRPNPSDARRVKVVR